MEIFPVFFFLIHFSYTVLFTGHATGFDFSLRSFYPPKKNQASEKKLGRMCYELGC